MRVFSHLRHRIACMPIEIQVKEEDFDQLAFIPGEQNRWDWAPRWEAAEGSCRAMIPVDVINIPWSLLMDVTNSKLYISKAPTVFEDAVKCSTDTEGRELGSESEPCSTPSIGAIVAPAVRLDGPLYKCCYSADLRRLCGSSFWYRYQILDIIRAPDRESKSNPFDVLSTCLL